MLEVLAELDTLTSLWISVSRIYPTLNWLYSIQMRIPTGLINVLQIPREDVIHHQEWTTVRAALN
jgi:hypothetical protein